MELNETKWSCGARVLEAPPYKPRSLLITGFFVLEVAPLLAPFQFKSLLQ